MRSGFQNTTAVELPGEFSHRGGIIDIFAPDWFNPVRIELFGDEIESIRQFEVASQRSLERVESVEVTAVARAGGEGERKGAGESGRGQGEVEGKGLRIAGGQFADCRFAPSSIAHLADYLPPRSWFLLIEPGELESEGRQYLERLERPQGFHSVADVIRRAVQFPSVTASAIATGSLETTCRLPIESVERFSGHIDKVREELDDAGRGQEVFLICQTEAEVRRLGEVLPARSLPATAACTFPSGRCKTASGWCPTASCC